METERISWRKVRRQMWFEERKRDLIKIKDKAVDGALWVWDHKVEIGEREIYDPSLHKTLKLKRKLSTRQKREIQARFDEGEKIHNIIVDMGILK